jgi:hypothetical protein
MYLQLSHRTTAQRDNKDDDEDEVLEVVVLKPLGRTTVPKPHGFRRMTLDQLRLHAHGSVKVQAGSEMVRSFKSSRGEPWVSAGPSPVWWIAHCILAMKDFHSSSSPEKGKNCTVGLPSRSCIRRWYPNWPP